MTIKLNEETLAKFFAKAFHEVVVPVIEDLKKEMATKEDIARLERKLDKQEERQDRQGQTMDKHEQRIEKLEAEISAH